MKHAKMLGLAVVAALALMALAGAASASATTVCSNSGTGSACASGKEYSGGFSASLKTGTTATLTSGFITVKCSVSGVGGTVATNGSGTITSLTFSECTSGLGACTAATTASAGNPWSGAVTHTSADDGTMSVNNVEGEFTCAGTKCVYGAATAGGSGEIVVNGGEAATVTATKVPLSKKAGSSSLCSSTATWSGDYNVTSPNGLYIF